MDMNDTVILNVLVSILLIVGAIGYLIWFFKKFKREVEEECQSKKE